MPIVNLMRDFETLLMQFDGVLILTDVKIGISEIAEVNRFCVSAA